MPIRREAALRRAAILLASVPPKLAEALLQRLPTASAQRLRRAVTELEDIDPLERQRALESLRESLIQAASSGTNTANSTGLDLRAALDAKSNDADLSNSENGQPIAANPAASRPPLDFLQDIDENLLARALSDEHPRTIALVLCHMPPIQAARVLAGWQPELRFDVVKRMSTISETTPEVLTDLTDHLRNLLPKLTPSPLAQGRAGASALMEISQHLEPMLREELARMVAPSNSALAATLHLNQAAVTETPQVQGSPLRVVGADADDGASDALPIAFSDVEQLPTPALRRVFAEAEESLALLALSGCRPQTAQRLLSGMPRRQGKLVQQQLANIGPLTLRDVDRAQERMAEVAWALHQAGRLPELVIRHPRRAA
jgi:flagellar motor switch protein FliG